MPASVCLPPAPLSSGRRQAAVLAAAAALLVLYWLLATTAARHWSQTSDEAVHVTAGYVYDLYGDFRFQPENGVLPQRLHGLGPLLHHAELPPAPEWWAAANPWQLSWSFFYEGKNPTDAMLATARGLNALLGVALGALIFGLARRRYGDGGGLVALAFYALCPNFLAHGALATSDVGATLALTGAGWFFWIHLGRRDLRSGLVAALFSGLALTMKFNGVLVLPIYLLLGLVDLARDAAAGRRGRRLAQNLGLGLLQAVAAGGFVWACYGFRFALIAENAPALGQPHPAWPAPLAAPAPPHAAVLATLLHGRLLPEAWLYGLADVLRGAQGRPSFLAGERGLHGWVGFFPTLFLAKTSLALLIALVATIPAARLAGGKSGRSKESLLFWAAAFVPAAVIGAAALTSSINIGHRHILAVYPPLFVVAGGLARCRGRWLLVPGLLLAGQAVESFAVRPHYLAFFNALAGGPSQGYRLAVDSSLDWGQGLPALRDWLAVHRRPGERLHLAYFGNAWPPHYGVRPDVFLPDGSNFVRPPASDAGLGPGLYAISATSLSGTYADWHGELATASPAVRATEAAQRAQFQRLREYLWKRAPDAQPGHAILVFRLDQAELDAVFTRR